MPTPYQVHVDAPLTSMSLAKAPITDYIGLRILKPMSVVKESDKLFTYGDDTFFTTAGASGQRLYQHAPGADYAKVEYDITSTQTYFCEDYGLEIPVPIKVIKNADKPLQPLSTAGAIVAGHLLNAQEQRFSTLLQDSTTTFSSYTSTPAAQWDAAAPIPFDDRNTAVQSMMENGSYNPVVHDLICVMGIKGWHLAQRNADLIDSIKGTRDASVITEEDFRKYLQVNQLLIGRGTYNTAKKGQSISLDYIWDGDKVSFFAVPKGSPGDAMATLGATFTWTAENGGAMPTGMAMDRFLLKKQKRYDVVANHCVDEIVLMASCGFIFTNVFSGI